MPAADAGTPRANAAAEDSAEKKAHRYESDADLNKDFLQRAQNAARLAADAGELTPICLGDFDTMGFVKPCVSAQDATNLCERIEGRLEPRGLLVVWGEPGHGKRKAAEYAALEYLKAKSNREGLPEDQTGVYTTDPNLPFKDTVNSIRKLAGDMGECPCVFIIKHNLSGLIDNDATEGWSRLRGAVKDSNACLIAFWEDKGRRPKAPHLEWRPFYPWRKVFRSQTEEAEETLFDSLADEFEEFFTQCRNERLREIIEDWNNGGRDHDIIRRHREVDDGILNVELSRQAMIDELLAAGRPPSELAWVVAACVLSGTEDRAFPPSVRRLASLFGADYQPLEVDLRVADRLGRKTQSVEASEGENRLIGLVNDENLAEAIVQRFRRVHAEIYRDLLVALGTDPHEGIQVLAVRRAVELCEESTDLWDDFAAGWQEVDTNAYSHLVAHAYQVPCLSDRVYKITKALLLDTLEHHVEHPLAFHRVKGLLAVHLGSCADRRRGLFTELLNEVDFLVPWLLVNLASADETGATAGDLLLALAEWSGPTGKDGKGWSSQRQIDEITEVAKVIVGDRESPSVFDPWEVSDGMVYGWVRLLLRVFGGEAPPRGEIRNEWYRLFLQIAREGSPDKGTFASWLRCTSAVLREIPFDPQAPNLSAWDAFLRWLREQRVDDGVRSWIDATLRETGDQDFSAIYRRELAKRSATPAVSTIPEKTS